MELKDRLLEKSKEAFCMAIELYNKPTIRYRVTGTYGYSIQSIDFIVGKIKNSPLKDCFYKYHTERKEVAT